MEQMEWRNVKENESIYKQSPLLPYAIWTYLSSPAVQKDPKGTLAANNKSTCRGENYVLGGVDLGPS